MIDLHCHLLAGLDDGPASLEGALALAERAHAQGTRTMVATPHVSWRYRNDSAAIADAARRMRAALADQGVELEILTGAEIAMTRLPELSDDELRQLALGGERWLLLEPPFTAVAAGLSATTRDLQARGFGVVLAHPERCAAFQHDPALLESLVGEGAVTSLTAGSLSGQFGRRVRANAFDLLERRLVHNVASDAHDALHRSPEIRSALEQAQLDALTEWLTSAVPAAILEDASELPPRPRLEASPPTRRRRLWPRPHGHSGRRQST